MLRVSVILAVLLPLVLPIESRSAESTHQHEDLPYMAASIHGSEAPTLELALYRVNDSDAFPSLQADVHKHLRNFRGFVEAQSIRSSSCVDCFGDLVVWASLDAALAAAKTLPTLASAAKFLAAIRQIDYFGHAMASPGSKLLPPLASPGAVVEVRISMVTDEHSYDSAYSAYLSEAAAALPGLRQRVVYAAGVEQHDGRVEVCVWSDAAAAAQGDAALSRLPARKVLESLVSNVVYEDIMIREKM